jgi:cellulose 1,4-beta-cellobiosidase
MRRLSCLLLLLAVGLVLAPAAAQADATTCSRSGILPVANNRYQVWNNEYGSTAPFCTMAATGTSFTVASSELDNPSTVAAYPSIGIGCAWYMCTAPSELPIRLSDPASAVSSWSTSTAVPTVTGSYNVTYDLWLTTTPMPHVPDGTELMIWLDHNSWSPPITAKVTIGGAEWGISIAQKADGTGRTWTRLAYVRTSGVRSVSNLDLRAFIGDAVRRGAASRSLFLSDVQAGFEIWRGGAGLRSDAFSFAASATDGAGPGLQGAPEVASTTASPTVPQPAPSVSGAPAPPAPAAPAPLAAAPASAHVVPARGPAASAPPAAAPAPAVQRKPSTRTTPVAAKKAPSHRPSSHKAPRRKRAPARRHRH